MRFEKKIEMLLKELELLNAKGRFPNINRETAEFIYKIIVDEKLKRVFEFGACNGYSTIWMALAVKEIDGNLITTEWGKDKFKWLDENIKKSGLKEFINAYNQDARKFLKENTKEFDFIFLDGMAKLYLEIFKLLEGNMSDKCVVIADNIISHKEKLQDFINYVKMNPKYNCEIIREGKGIMIIRKK